MIAITSTLAFCMALIPNWTSQNSVCSMCAWPCLDTVIPPWPPVTFDLLTTTPWISWSICRKTGSCRKSVPEKIYCYVRNCQYTPWSYCLDKVVPRIANIRNDKSLSRVSCMGHVSSFYVPLIHHNLSGISYLHICKVSLFPSLLGRSSQSETCDG